MTTIISEKIAAHKAIIAVAHANKRAGALSDNTAADRIKASSRRLRQLKKDLAREVAREAA